MSSNRANPTSEDILANFEMVYDDKEWEVFPQKKLTSNYQLLQETFGQVGIELLPLDNKGICLGLSYAYLFYAKQERRDEFFDGLRFVETLNPIDIKQLFQTYLQKKNRA